MVIFSVSTLESHAIMHTNVCTSTELDTQTSTIGGRLREERKRLGHSQSQFAELAGVHKNAQGNYESDLRRPDTDYLVQIAQAGVDVPYVLFGEHSSASLAPDEAMLLHGWRRLDKRARAGVLALMGGLEEVDEPAPATKTRASGHAQVINGGSNNVQIGSVKTGRRKAAKTQ
ncbi:helix-turn-helix domain-containing protein [Ralstonia pseudosolanacearum]|uniref:helix-turn-helix domain-containing protein n=1 Tax=Ralstonia pseudosolanacearum TaxID=1310165 RepID=UPI001FFC088E|nr:helix-turn-helix domain-containing protein [Ralstonia pseudosolanacearum]